VVVIAQIEFREFKILRKAEIALTPFNLVIGPNGSGKTSVIEAVRRLRTLAALPTLPGIEPEAHSGSRLVFRFNPPHDGLSVVLACSPDLECDALRVSGNAAALAGWSDLAARVRSIRFHTLDAAAMALPCMEDGSSVLTEDGGNIAAALNALKSAKPGEFAAVEAEFMRILPEFAAIVPVREGDNFALEFALNGEERRIRASRLSQGTLALLGILLVTIATPRPAMVCIEEVDRGLHPRVLREARDALYRLSHPGGGEPACQVIATTHSPYLLDLFRDQPEEVVIAEKTGSRASFRRLSDIGDLQSLMAEASLGDLWFSGVLGGVPEEE
jgi:predicted ATPase